jgi:transposase-like protein
MATKTTQKKERFTYKSRYLKQVAQRYFKGETIEAIARDMGIARSSIYNWVKDDEFKEELERLRDRDAKIREDALFANKTLFEERIKQFDKISEELIKSYQMISLTLNKDVIEVLNETRANSKSKKEFFQSLNDMGLANIIRASVTSSGEVRALTEQTYSLTTVAQFISRNSDKN